MTNFLCAVPGWKKKLPLEANADLVAALFNWQHGERRPSFGQNALSRAQIVAVAVIAAAEQPALEELSGGF